MTHVSKVGVLLPDYQLTKNRIAFSQQMLKQTSLSLRNIHLTYTLQQQSHVFGSYRRKYFHRVQTEVDHHRLHLENLNA